MGLDDLECLDRMRVEGRVLQGGDQGLAHGESLGIGKLRGGIMDAATQPANRLSYACSREAKCV
jgi:hypothetical protein